MTLLDPPARALAAPAVPRPPVALPDGQRTLLLCDMVDSTALALRLGDAASAALWAAHDRVARDLLRDWNGLEIDKSDGMLALFARTDEAVGFALAYHRALARLPQAVSCRVGLHVGPVLLRRNHGADVARGAKPLEVDGLAKSIAARVMAVAQGGQTLLSAQALAALQALAPGHRRLQSHGYWQLKGVAEPVRLFEVGDEHTRFEPPPDGPKAWRVLRRGTLWLPARQVRHRLPAERDRFIGRQAPLLDLAQRIESGARLVSVLGPGGIGKTRLAVHFAWSWLGEFPGGLWFCDLSAARDAEGIAQAVGAALELAPGPADMVQRITATLAQRGRCLLLLDNFEQVTRHAESTIGCWLDGAPEACLVVTSRELLGLSGEQALNLAPLSTEESVAMFMRRAEAVRPDFAPGAAERAAVVQLVRWLDGLPLAIELAAARVRLMAPHLLLARMDERFRLLASSGGRCDRQATLRATIDWSWDLLDGAERQALAQLSVFAGSFPLPAAEAVIRVDAADGSATAHWPTDLLQQLVDKSFVRTRDDGRFELLDSIRQYAGERLTALAAGADARARHAAFYAAIGEDAAAAQACIECDNLVAACRHASATGLADAALASLLGAWAALRLRGPFGLAATLAAGVSALTTLDDAGRARADWVAASALLACGRRAEARGRFESALARARAAADRRCEGRVLASLAELCAAAGQLGDAQAHSQAALALARQAGDSALECEVHSGLGTLCDYQGRIDDARRHYEAALAVARASRDRRLEGGMLGNLGLLHANQGRMDLAGQHFEAALAVATSLGDRPWAGNALCNLGMLHQMTGRNDEALQRLGEALAIAREIDHGRLECVVLCNLGIVAEAARMPNEARAHFEAALVAARMLGDQRSEGQFLNYLGLLHARQLRHGDAAQALTMAEGLLQGLGDTLGLALLLCNRAEAEQLAHPGRAASVAAVQAVDRAQALAATLGAGPASELGLALARVRQLLGVQVALGAGSAPRAVAPGVDGPASGRPAETLTGCG